MKKILLIALVLVLSTANPVFSQNLLPYPFFISSDIIAFIEDTCDEVGLDPHIVYLVIGEESQWNMNPKPNPNVDGTFDYGPMQLNSDYIPWFIEKFGEEGMDPINNVYDNLELGIKNLAYLWHLFDQDLLLTSYAYNCGPTRTLSGRIPKRTLAYGERIVEKYLERIKSPRTFSTNLL